MSELAFTPEGVLIVSAAEDGTLRIWSCASGLCVAVLHGGVDASGLAAGDPWLARVLDTGDFELLSLDTFDRAASFPALLGHVVSLADLRTYVGVARAPTVHALRLEGRVDPARPLLECAASLASSWRALARAP